MAMHLVKKANVVISTENGCQISDIYKFQKVMPNYNISLYSKKEGVKPLISGPLGERKDINIFYLEQISHFIKIKNTKTFFNKRFQCKHCRLFYTKKKSS